MPHRRCILCGRHWVLPSACSSVVLDKICVTCMWFALCWWLCCVQVHRLCAPRDPLCIGCGCVAIFRHGFNWVLCGTLFVFPLLHCLPPVLRPHWWCLVSALLRCCIQALICCVLCVCVCMLYILLSRPVFLHFNHLTMVVQLSSYVNAILVMRSGLARFCCGALR